jgi:hypothetical protein
VRKSLFCRSIVALALAAAPLALADDIVKWTDPQGQTHYSNRSGSAGQEPAPSEPDSDSGGQGWESVLEKQKGTEKFQEKAEAAINNLEMQMIRKNRDRAQAQEALEGTQESILRTQSANSSSADLPRLRTREANQINELKKLEIELGALKLSIARVRALKSAERDQRSTP